MFLGKLVCLLSFLGTFHFWSGWIISTQIVYTDLLGDESLEAEDVGWGLDGAENIGHDGDRGDVGLGDNALREKHVTYKLLRSNTVGIKK